MEKFATKTGTEQYCKRFPDLPKEHFTNFQDLRLSSIGFGTYMGNPDEATDLQYHNAVKLAVSLGCNVIDSAINYRFQRSERSMGKALLELFNQGFKREEIFISTKGGFLSFDQQRDEHPRQWFKRMFVDKKLATPEDLVASCHCLAPAYLRSEIEQSIQNLGLTGIDLYYLHNPEIQLEETDRDTFEKRIKNAFTTMEQAVSDGLIRFYGTATWTGYRMSPDSKDYLSLQDIINWATEVGGVNHHFKAIQLPYSLATPEAFLQDNQREGSSKKSILEVAKDLGIGVFASASLMQGQIIGSITDSLKQKLPKELETDAQLGLHFVRSTPGITSALVGMKQLNHVKENLKTAKVPPLTKENFNQLLS